MIGQTILHYNILEKLGEGGMGVVYLAEDTKLKREVAIKFLPGHIAANTEDRERFKIEAQAAASLNHPNIATIYAIEEYDNELFIVMEYIAGRELKEEVRSGKFETERAVKIAKQIAEGLQAAHSKGIVHRDIKSSNIMITENDKVKIMDFGLAKVGKGIQLTKEHSTLGTAAYMSPEQARGEEVDLRSDIWSFGVLLYEMLTGSLPFKGDYEQAVIYSILNEEIKPMIFSEKIQDKFMINLVRIIEVALSKSVEERYQNVNELLTDLMNVESEKKSGETISNYKKIFGKKSKHSKIYILLYSSLVVLIFLITFFLIQTPEIQIIDSIAVLPMENISNNPEMEFLTDGMTEAMIAELAKIEALRVISRTSIMRYKNTDKTLPEIAEELNVRAILEGSAVILSNQIRITAQLINSKTDEHIWVKQYDSDLKDIFALYSNVANDVAHQIKIKLTSNDKKRLASAQQVNPRAYRLYIEGMKYRNLEGIKNYQQAAELFSKAVEIDPDFALAYARLALCYSILKGIYGSPGDKFISKAKEAMNKAIELNDNLAETYVALGLFQMLIKNDWMQAEKSFRHAIQLNPGSIEPHMELGLLLTRYGNNLDDAFEEFKLVKELDPFSPRAISAGSEAYLQIGDFDKVIELCSKRLEAEPEQRIVRAQLGYAYIFMDNPQKGIIEFEKLLTGERDAIALSGIGLANGILGMKENAQKIITEVRKKWPGIKGFPALIDASLGNWEPYLNYLEQNWEKHQKRPLFYLSSSFFNPVHSNPRFIALMKNMRME
jgi:non-specific serine/threonine protein kinase